MSAKKPRKEEPLTKTVTIKDVPSEYVDLFNTLSFMHKDAEMPRLEFFMYLVRAEDIRGYVEKGCSLAEAERSSDHQLENYRYFRQKRNDNTRHYNDQFLNNTSPK